MYMAALFGSSMYLLDGCGWDVGGQWRWVLAILQEDLFG